MPNDTCRGSFRNMKRHERKHDTQGNLQQTSADGVRLDFNWASFHPQIEGVCHTPDGQLYTLRLTIDASRNGCTGVLFRAAKDVLTAHVAAPGALETL